MKIDNKLIEVLHKFNKNKGVNIYYIGACVRDKIINNNSKHIDILIKGVSINKIAKCLK